LLPLLLPALHLLLLPFLLRNLSFWGIRLVALGLCLNLAVMVANGGLMPVDESTVEAVGRHQGADLEVGSHIPGTKNVLLERGDIRLRFLSDTLLLPVPRPFTKAISVGDVLIAGGVIACLSEVIYRTGGQRKVETPA
jgi:hypothetical protein